MKKIGFMMVVSMMVLSFSGCGGSTANNLGGTKSGYGTNGYNKGYSNGSYGGDMTGGYGTSGGAAYWDGYGVNSGRPITNGSNNGITNDLKNVGNDMANGVNRALTGNTASMAN